MAFPSEFLDQLRARIPVSEVVGKHVVLKKRGHEFVGLSPFKQEKTPSFTVNDSRGFYHCFSTGEHGDIVTFLMKVEGLSFLEAVEKLALMVGLVVPNIKPERPEVIKKTKTLYDVMAFAQVYFTRALKGDQGRAAQAYLDNRGIPRDVQDYFALGYSDGQDGAFIEAAAQQGFTLQDLIDAGLCRKDDGGRPYAFFRQRIMFPVRDVQGRIVAFGGRVFLPDAKGGKYINSPETKLFDKGSTLYHFSQARTHYKTHQLLIVEGYIDVISLHQYGFPCVVAPLGTALTERQMALIWRTFDSPCLCFDGDEAGQKAAERAAFRILPYVEPGKTLQFLFFPEGDDPDSFMRMRGKAAFNKLLEAQKSLFDVAWESCARRHHGTTPEMRAMLEKEIESVIATIKDPLVKKHYQRMFREKLWHAFTTPRAQKEKSREKRIGTKRHYQPIKEEVTIKIDVKKHEQEQDIIKQKIILATLINHPKILEGFVEDLSRIVWQDDLGRVASVLQEYIIERREEALWFYLDHAIGDKSVLDSILSEHIYRMAAQSKKETEDTDASVFLKHMINLYVSMRAFIRH